MRRSCGGPPPSIHRPTPRRQNVPPGWMRGLVVAAPPPPHCGKGASSNGGGTHRELSRSIPLPELKLKLQIHHTSLVGEVASAAAMVERPTRWRVTPTSVPRRQLGLGLLALLLLGQRADWATASRATHKPKRRSKATSAAPPTEDPPPLLRFPAAGPHADDW
jgi:hypothetical protein